MYRTLLCLIVSLSSTCLAQPADLNLGQVEIAGSWRPQTTDVDLPSFGGHAFQANTLAATVSVGVLPQRLSVFGSIGTGNIEMPNMGIEGSIDHYGRAGLRVTAWHSGPWSVGMTVDVQQWKAQDSFLLADHPFGARVSLTEYRVRPTLARQIGPVMFYGGPEVVWLDGSWALFWGGTRDERYSVHAKAKFGGFIGAQWQVYPHITLTAEGEITELGQAAVVGIGYRF
jgi:hypothetical protein